MTLALTEPLLENIIPNTVLVVEGDAAQRECIVENIRAAWVDEKGESLVKVLTASTKKAALNVLKKDKHRSISAIILDSTLEKDEQGGLELLKELCGTEREHPTVFFTANVDGAIIVEAIKNGAGEYLDKKKLLPEELLESEGAPSTELITINKPLQEALRISVSSAIHQFSCQIRERIHAQIVHAQADILVNAAKADFLEEKIQYALERSLQIKSMGVLPKGSVAIVRKNPDGTKSLIRIAEFNLGKLTEGGYCPQVIEDITQLDCHCPRAALQKRTIDVPHLYLNEGDCMEGGVCELHEVKFPGIPDHGHHVEYRERKDSTTSAKIEMVANFYLEPGARLDEIGKEFVRDITDFMADLILQEENEKIFKNQQETHRRQALFFNSADVGGIMMDGELNISDINLAFLKMILDLKEGDELPKDINIKDLGMRTIKDLLKFLEPYIGPQEDPPTKEEFHEMLKGKMFGSEKGFNINVYVRSTAGAKKLVNMKVNRANGEKSSRVILWDPSAEALHNLVHQSTHDAMTELPNRTLFGDRLEQRIASVERSKSGRKLAYFFIDLNFLKYMNEEISHEFADAAICEAARRLDVCFKRKTDTIARVGGDEFKGVADVRSEEEAENIARTILAAFDKPFEFEGIVIPLRIAIGWDIFDPKKSENLSKLDENSDKAMIQAKRRGKGKHADVPRESISLEIIEETGSYAMSFAEAV